MEAAFCIEAVEEALARYGRPDIFNTDQGSQFTSVDLMAVLKKAESSSQWMAKLLRDGTMCSASGSGVQSNTRKCTSMPIKQCPRPALALAAM